MANAPSDYLTLDPTEVDDFATAATVGWAFTVAADTHLTGLRWYATRTMTVDAYLWVSEAPGTTPSAQADAVSCIAGWNSIPLDADLAPGTTYAVGIHQNNGDGHVYYTATPGISSATFGPIQTGTTAGRWIYNPTADGPPDGQSDSWYGVDVVAQAQTPTEGATGHLTVPVSLTGQAVKHGAAAALLEWSAVLTGQAVKHETSRATSGHLAVPVTLDGKATKRAQASAALHVPVTLTGTTTAREHHTATGSLHVTPWLTGTAVKHAHTTGHITVPVVLTAVNPDTSYTPATDPTGTVTAPDLHTEVTVGTLTTGDYGYPIGGQALDGDQPHDCTGTTGELHLRRTDGTVLISDVTWTDPATGEWSYTIEDGDLTVPGAYSLEIQVSVDDRVVQTFPGGSLQVREQFDT